MSEFLLATLVIRDANIVYNVYLSVYHRHGHGAGYGGLAPMLGWVACRRFVLDPVVREIHVVAWLCRISIFSPRFCSA